MPNRICTKVIQRLFILVAVFSFTLVSLAAPSPQPRTYDLTIVHTNDFHGYDQMSLARKATLIKQIRTEAKNLLVLDGGDLFSRGEYHTVFYGALEMAVLNEIRYDAWTLGNNELKCDDDGPSTLKHIDDLVKQATFPTLSANIMRKDKNYLKGVKPYVVKDVGGVKIGIFGLTNSNKVSGYPQASDLLVRDCLMTAKWLVPQVAAKSDIVISLSHAGLSFDEAIANDVKGIAAIISADDHQLLDPPMVVKGIPIVQTGGEAEQYLGKLDLSFTYKDGKWKLTKWTEKLIPITENVPVDEAVKNIIDSYIEKLSKPAA